MGEKRPLRLVYIYICFNVSLVVTNEKYDIKKVNFVDPSCLSFIVIVIEINICLVEKSRIKDREM